MLLPASQNFWSQVVYFSEIIAILYKNQTQISREVY